MRAGLLRHRIEIQEQTQTPDAAGQPIRTWSTVFTRWGSIEPLRGQERVEAEQVKSKTTVKIQLRYCAVLTTEYRLKHGGKFYNIDSIVNVGEREIMHEINAVEVADEGAESET